MILDLLKKANCQVFMVVDSCYSGQMIEDMKNLKISLSKDVHNLTSTSHALCAMKGWKLVQLLINNIFVPFTYTNPTDICNTIQENLITQLQGQSSKVTNYL